MSFSFTGSKRTTLAVLNSSFFMILLLSACVQKKSFKLENARGLINYEEQQNDKTIAMDYFNAIDSGFVIPSISQTPSGYFTFSFTVTNESKEEGFAYKLFYQNESYMFEEVNSGTYNPLSGENFYGSWSDNTQTIKIVNLKQGETITITDSLRIIGNPRNEELFFGRANRTPVDENIVASKIAYIKSDAAWYQSIVEKAKKENRTIDEQLRLDVLYVMDADNNISNVNNRWKRNPRTGTYRFYLLVAPLTVMTEIPSYVSEIGRTVDNNFINPVYLIKHGVEKHPYLQALTFPQTLKVTASPDLGSGIFVNKEELKNKTYTKEFYSNHCNDNLVNYKNAHFEQYFHHLPERFLSPGIPEVRDVQSDELTIGDYKKFTEQYPKSTLLPHTNVATRCPCETVFSDSVNKKIVMKNPGYRRDLKEKENTGVFSRHGFTYGTYTFKVKMPELLNKNNFWNGLTNAMWLINQSNEPWNKRRFCDGNGYIPKEMPGDEHSPRKREVSYTEIDFEIRKGSPVWPVSSYPQNTRRPDYDGKDSSDVVVLCTNWDLACNEPEFFNAGARSFSHNNNNYTLHRWTHWYQALSSKYAASDDELFKGDYYYFQVEWKPTSITWRIGPEKNKLREVCFMDKTVTVIPNNQMLVVFTQEYHISDWWPESQYLLEYIPVPQKDIMGEILNVEIE